MWRAIRPLGQSAINTPLNLGGRVTLVRCMSQNFDWGAFNKGAGCTAENILKTGREGYPTVFRNKTVDFTALKHALQNIEELSMHVRCFGRYKGQDGKPVADMILYGPQRRSLQILGALVPLLLKTPAKNRDFGDFILDLHKNYVLPEMPEIDMLSNRPRVFDKVSSMLLNQKKQVKNPKIAEYFSTLKNGLIQRRQEGIIEATDSRLVELAVTHIADDLLRRQADQQIYAMVDRIIEHLINSGQCEPLPLVSPKQANTFVGIADKPPTSYPNRFSVLMAGGPGSGKSITTENVALQLQKQTGCSLDELSLLTVDRMRTIYDGDDCVLAAEKKHCGTLTHAEAVVTCNMSGTFLELRMDQNKKVPNVFQEMTNIWPRWLDIGFKKDGTYFISISTRKPENAVDGVIERGLTNSNFITPPEYVLSSYRSVSERFPLVVKENQSKKLILSVTNNEQAIQRKFSDTIEQKSEQTKNNPAVVVDCENNTIYIVNLLQYVDFINQSQLNSKAISADQLFEGADLSIPTSMERIVDPNKFGSAKFAFIQKGVTSSSINTLEENIVATVQNGVITVKDQEGFESLQADYPDHFSELEQLSAQQFRY